MYQIEFEELGAVGNFARAEGLGGEQRVFGSETVVVRLLDGTISGALLEWARTGSRWTYAQFGNSSISYTGKDGSPIYESFLVAEPKLTVGLSELGAVEELILHTSPGHVEPEAITMAPRWREERASPYEWRDMPFQEKLGWLHLVRGAIGRKHDDVQSSKFVLEGSRITDVPSLYLALGEAMNGPRGYYGSGLDALSDCLCGGFGPVPPYTLIFKNSEEAKHYLTWEAWQRFSLSLGSSVAEGVSLWDELLELLGSRVNLVLE
tara:strand:+ start:46523 stop:47314 length:792 start_codon:yes stop_codon:yes gene_type:complete